MAPPIGGPADICALETPMGTTGTKLPLFQILDGRNVPACSCFFIGGYRFFMIFLGDDQAENDKQFAFFNMFLNTGAFRIIFV